MFFCTIYPLYGPWVSARDMSCIFHQNTNNLLMESWFYDHFLSKLGAKSCAESNVLMTCLVSHITYIVTGYIVTLLAFVWFFPQYNFKWVLKHICFIYLNFFCRVFSNASLNGMSGKMHNYNGCICISFLHFVLSNVSSNCLLLRLHCHIGCICLIILCIFKRVFRLPAQEDTKSHWLHFFTFLHCGFSNVSSTRFNEMIYIYISDFFSLNFFPIWCYICFYFSLLGLFIWVCKLLRWEDVKLHRLHLFVF